MKKGIALIDLIITIIVVVILAAISIYSGYGTIGKANLAKFTQEFSNFETAIRNIARDKRQNYVLSGARKSDSDIYKEIAGSDVPLDVPKKLKKNISGTVLYEIVVDEISGIDPKKFGGKTYISDKGEVLVIPAYQTLSSDGTLIEYASSSIKYPVVPSLTDKVRIGDYIEYTGKGESIVIAKDVAGQWTGKQTLTPSSTIWRVWDITEDERVVIAPFNSNDVFSSGGGPAILKHLEFLDNFRRLYVNPELGVGLDDIKICDEAEVRSKTIDYTPQYMEQRSYVEDGYNPCIVYVASDGRTILPEVFIPSSSNTITITPTEYERFPITWKSIDNPNFPGLTYADLLGARTYSMPEVYVGSQYNGQPFNKKCYFGIVTFAKGFIDKTQKINASGGEEKGNEFVLPLVTLGSKVVVDKTATDRDGTSSATAWKIVAGK